MILSKFEKMSKNGDRSGDLGKTVDMWYIRGICNLYQSACAQLRQKVVVLAIGMNIDQDMLGVLAKPLT